MLVPAPARRPNELPDAGTRPFGNGFARVTVGVPAGCGDEVLFVNPIWPKLPLFDVGLGAG